MIGKDNRLPWKLPRDLQHFKKLTLGKPVIMGRRTFESIGRPLPHRRNIVLTRRADYEPAGCAAAATAEEALELCAGADEIMILGGGDIFRQFLPRADRQYLTLVRGRFHGDTLYPEFDPDEWLEVAREDWPADEQNPYACSVVTLDRKTRS